MVKLLCVCLRDGHEDFRLAELESCAKLFNVDIHYDATNFTEESIYLYVEFPSEDAARQVIGRCVLMKGVYEVWADCGDYDTLLKSVETYFEQHQDSIQEYVGPQTTFKIEIDPYGNKLTRDERTERVARFNHLPIHAKLNKKTPQNEFYVMEQWEGATHLKDDIRLVRLLFARRIGGSSRELLTTYDLKKRHYIGTTSMNATLSFLVSNQALVKNNSFVLDPFVGTGSLLTSAAHWGAHVVGSDLDMRVLRGKDNTQPKKVPKQFRRKPLVEQPRDQIQHLNLDTNFDQYGLTSRTTLDLIRVDLNQCHVWRFANMGLRAGGVFDAIICDPPYGIRAGARKIGKKEELVKTVSEEFEKNHIPATEVYEIGELLNDLLEFAAKAIILGGRLVYWFPTTPAYQDSDLPTHRCFIQISNSCEVLNSKNHRRLITLEKVAE